VASPKPAAVGRREVDIAVIDPAEAQRREARRARFNGGQ
jgi:hypothetical protein